MASKFREWFSTKSSGQDSASGASPDEDTSNLASVRSELSRNRKRGNKVEREVQSAEIQRELDRLYTPENWKEISTLYFDCRYVATGDDVFSLKDSEKTTLGVSLAASARFLLKIDPGYVALIIFMANMGKLIAVKETQYRNKKRKGTAGPRAVQAIA